MGTGRELLWFYVRPRLHAALSERAARRGRDLELEIVDILESATRPTQQPSRQQAHLRLLPADEREPAS